MKLDTSKIRGLVLDLDGTLIDSYDAIAQSLNHALERIGRAPIDAAGVRRMVGRGLETLIARALGLGLHGESDPLVAEAVGHFRARYDEICEQETVLLPGVAGTLSELAGEGYALSVATNKPSYFARRILDALHVGRLIPIVLGPDRVSHHKPHPEMVLAALSAMKLDPDQALYVGDMEIDVQTARAAGVPVVVVPTGSSDRGELEKAGADAILPGFASLLELLDGAGPRDRRAPA